MFSKIPPMKAEIPPQRHFFLQVKCPELSSYSKKTYTHCSAWTESAVGEVSAVFLARKP